jgi:hypothetical protein
MARLNEYLKLNDTINSIISHALEENESIKDTETESLMWEKMWNDIEQTEKYYNNRYW